MYIKTQLVHSVTVLSPQTRLKVSDYRVQHTHTTHTHHSCTHNPDIILLILLLLLGALTSLLVFSWSFPECPQPEHQANWVIPSFLGISKLAVIVLVAQSCPTLRPRGVQPTRLLSPWYSPGKNTGVGCHFLLQRIFPTQGSNPSRQILYCLSYREAVSMLY